MTLEIKPAIKDYLEWNFHVIFLLIVWSVLIYFAYDWIPSPITFFIGFIIALTIRKPTTKRKYFV